MRTVALLLIALSAPGQDLPLHAGLAKVDLTPSSSMPMYGYSNRRCGPSAGIHDSLYAKALVLASGASKMAIVTLDLGSFVSEKLVADIKGKLGIPVVLLAASHTHSGPAFLPPSANQPAYLADIEGKIFEAVKRAGESMFPASLAVSRGSIQLGYNRLLPRDDGRSRALFDNLERIPYGPVDPEFVNLHVLDSAGATKALLVHYAVHAVVLGPTNCLYSADYPGVLQSKVEAEMSGVQAMFVQGGAGDINPLFMARSGNSEADFAVVRKMGETLAASVLRAAREPKPLSPNRHPIEVRAQVHQYSDRWDKTQSLSVGITTVVLNREIAIAATPGELMHKLQTEWKQRAEVAVPLFYGYTYSSGGIWPGYIPDLKTAAHGGYGADVTTRIAIGAGEDIVQRHLIHLYEILGMWRDQPGRP
ncbi:MAG: neutral/alkaline non-lysosomal ceramidase N-terminal domain-containing protein [Bryobacterales bacterium]|nr:neutral/alkaline non-lysosomal ceramidase N-terminal domain-containing protein [Bryobacterales bacterium]